MDSDTKYQKLASEYAKLRAQASVLKKAVIEEQGKTSNLRELLRQRESALRRSEQEVDSLGFRNKQLEHRVAVLQEELVVQEKKKRDKDHKRSGKTDNNALQVGPIGGGGINEMAQDALIFEELQKKIMENAQLTSLIDDKERDLQLHTERVATLEASLEKRLVEQSELEKRLRREMENLQSRNSELETKLVDAASMLGSEDALSASGSDTTPLHITNNHHQASPAALGSTSLGTSLAPMHEDRLVFLEKEVAHWRTQYELAKMHSAFSNNNGKESKEMVNACQTAQQQQSIFELNDLGCACSTTAAALTVKPSLSDSKGARDSLKEAPTPPTKEQLIYNNFSMKFEDLLKSKCMAESRLSSYETEAKHLQNCLENASLELKSKDEQMQNVNEALRILEEDLATTRVNYEEQISVLTEQVISLSEQLAACK